MRRTLASESGKVNNSAGGSICGGGEQGVPIDGGLEAGHFEPLGARRGPCNQCIGAVHIFGTVNSASWGKSALSEQFDFG